MFFWRLKHFFVTLTAMVVAFGLAILVYAANAVKLQGVEGERIFYLRSASSQGLRAETLTIETLFCIKGESVTFCLGEGQNEWREARKIMKKYRAERVFEECVCGVTSYYCYTPQWTGGIVVGGRTVNLHIAVGEGRVTVGTPIIFDGY